MRIKILVAMTLFLAACASQDIELSRDDQIRMAQRSYQNKTPEQVIKAAEIVLRQADPPDFTFFHTPSGFTAYRKWFETLLVASASGTDIWDFRASYEPAKKTTIATVAIGGVASAVSHIAPNGSNGWGPSAPNPEMKPAVYSIFWARVEYVLGLRDEWISCAKAAVDPEYSRIPGDRLKLCSTFNMDGLTAPPPERL